MEQQSLLPAVAPYLSVWTDYGEIETGASRAHYVLAENGSEYIAKGPSFVPSHPTVAANEWVAAELATALALPLLDYRIVTMGGELFFASTWMRRESFATGIDRYLFNRCDNQHIVYELVVFDAWLINTDRHSGNLIVRLPKRTGDPHLAILNDHSHLLVSPSEPKTPEGLLSRLDGSPEPYVSLPFVREAITSRQRLSRAIDRVEKLPDVVIRDAVRSAPDKLLGAPYRAAYERFLLDRRTKLRAAFANKPGVFPNLQTA